MPALADALHAWDLPEPIRLTPLAEGFSANTWYVETPDRRLVAKAIYHGHDAFGPGLRAAEVLAEHAILCSATVRTRTGALSVLVEGAYGRAEPLALLQYVPGSPLDWGDPMTPGVAGHFLGRIHALWQPAGERIRAPDRIFAYIAEDTPEVAAQPGLRALLQQALANVRDFEAVTPVTYGVIVGDYMELLYDPATLRLGMIDTGAVSWGPLLFDVALMCEEPPAAGGASDPQAQFLQAYLTSGLIQPGELAGLRQYAALHWAQIAKYFAWRLFHQITLGDPDPDANVRSVLDTRTALETLLSTCRRSRLDPEVKPSALDHLA